MFYLLQFLTYALPVAAIVLFVISLVRYIRACRANRRVPHTYDRWQMTSSPRMHSAPSERWTWPTSVGCPVCPSMAWPSPVPR